MIYKLVHHAFQLQKTSFDIVAKLMDNIKQDNMALFVIDSSQEIHFSPGKPLITEQALYDIVANGRKSETISLTVAHNAIENSYHADWIYNNCF